MTAKSRLQGVRQARGLSQAEVITRFLARAQALRISTPTTSALKTMLSRWENGHDEVATPEYQRLFREVYGCTNAELGFPAGPEDETVTAFREHLTTARTVDVETVELFRQQIDTTRQLDRKEGGVPLLDALNQHIAEIQRRLTYSTVHRHREPLAVVLTDASTLAGWEALDRGSLNEAYRHHEIAKTAAREANSATLLAHATAQQAFILLDIGQPAEAVDMLSHARLVADGHAPRLLLSWLAAAHGEGLAATGDRAATLHAFDQADALLPVETTHRVLPFLAFNTNHLTWWRGSALTRLGDPEAVHDLTRSLAGTTFVRAQTVMLVDLAYAHAATGDRDAALHYARKARRLASQIGSDRQRRRLADLELPGTPRQ